MKQPTDPNLRMLIAFMAVIALLVVAMLGLPPLVDGIQSLKPGDAATWVSGLSTPLVAAIALKISRDSSRTARAALGNQLRVEAANVTWAFELPLLGSEVHDDSTIGWFVEEHLLPWERKFPDTGKDTAYAIVTVINNNPTILGEATMLVEHPSVNKSSAGMKSLGSLRSGTTRNLVIIDGGQASAGAVYDATELARANAYAKWLDFTDSNGYQWRRYANGQLESRDPRLKKLQA